MRSIALVSEFTSSSSKAEALASIVKRQREKSEQKHKDEWLTLLKQAETHAFSAEDICMQAQALRMIADEYIELEENSSARSLLEHAQKSVIAWNAVHPIGEVPRKTILEGIVMSFGKLAEQKAVLETTEVMNDPVHGASVLSAIAKNNDHQPKSNEALKLQTIQKLQAAEKQLDENVSGHDSELVDLQRVRLAEAWGELKMYEQIKRLSGKIIDPILKDLALSYAQTKAVDPIYEKSRELSEICKSASQLSSLNSA